MKLYKHTRREVWTQLYAAALAGYGRPDDVPLSTISRESAMLADHALLEVEKRSRMDGSIFTFETEQEIYDRSRRPVASARSQPMNGSDKLWAVALHPDKDAEADGVDLEPFEEVYRDLENAKSECSVYLDEMFEGEIESSEITWIEVPGDRWRGDPVGEVDGYFEIYQVEVK